MFVFTIQLLYREVKEILLWTIFPKNIKSVARDVLYAKLVEGTRAKVNFEPNESLYTIVSSFEMKLLKWCRSFCDFMVFTLNKYSDGGGAKFEP